MQSKIEELNLSIFLFLVSKQGSYEWTYPLINIFAVQGCKRLIELILKKKNLDSREGEALAVF